MNENQEWSPDEELGTETYASWDEALDAEDELQPGRLGSPEGERSLDRQLKVDELEVQETGAGLTDPETLAVLDGGIDDPDGAGVTAPVADGEDGWDLDAADRIAPPSDDEQAGG